MKALKSLFAASPALCGLVLLSQAAVPVHAQEQEPETQRRTEVGVQVSSGVRAVDPRLLGIVFYRRELGSGWLLGGGVGVGELARGSRAMVYAMNTGYRFAPLSDAAAVRPQIGLQFAVTFTLSNYEATSAQAFAGLAFKASPQLSFHVDMLAGRVKERSASWTGGADRVVVSNTLNARLGASATF